MLSYTSMPEASSKLASPPKFNEVLADGTKVEADAAEVAAREDQRVLDGFVGFYRMLGGCRVSDCLRLIIFSQPVQAIPSC